MSDGVFEAVMVAVERENCRRALLSVHCERVQHFARRIAELGRSPDEALIVVLSVDDRAGGQLADQLMPGHDWDAIRSAGAIPYARGLAGRSGIQEVVDYLDRESGDKLRAITDIAVVTLDRGVVYVCDESEVRS